LNAVVCDGTVDETEKIVIKKTWEEMAERNGGQGIDKDTFLHYFPLIGLLGGGPKY
jgi:hypothetical protein